MVNTKVTLCGLELDNPLIPASGTFGYGYEFAEHVLLYGTAAHVGHNGLTEALGQLGKLLGDDLLHTGILQTHGVDHATLALRNTGSGVTESGILGGSLEGEAAEAVDVVQLGELVAVAERAAGGDDGVVHLNTAKRHL